MSEIAKLLPLCCSIHKIMVENPILYSMLCYVSVYLNVWNLIELHCWVTNWMRPQITYVYIDFVSIHALAKFFKVLHIPVFTHPHINVSFSSLQKYFPIHVASDRFRNILAAMCRWMCWYMWIRMEYQRNIVSLLTCWTHSSYWILEIILFTDVDCYFVPFCSSCQ